MVTQNSVWKGLHKCFAPNPNNFRPNSVQAYNLSKNFGKKINHNCSSGLVESSFGKPAKLLSIKKNFFALKSENFIPLFTVFLKVFFATCSIGH